MYKLVLLRHGESVWNRENRFTGWTDVDLSPRGIVEAQSAGEILRSEGYFFDIAHTSLLKRAIRSLWIVLEEMDLMWIPVCRQWRLNERHYGALQGLNKAETAQRFGDEQVRIWRRSYDVPPPPLEPADPRNPTNEPKYKDLDKTDLPLTECLKDTVKRFLPLWDDTLVPQIVSGKRILIAAHGNSIRALIKHLDSIPDSQIPSLEIPTGVPLVYELDSSLRPLNRYYLGDPETVRKAEEAIKRQGRAKA